jgi:glucose-6-phosphate dehydrogenase assembly protein OpcA
MTLDVAAAVEGLAGERRKGPDDVMDVAVVTLVAFFDDPEIGLWLRDRLRGVTGKEPARVVVFDATREGGSTTVDGGWVEFAAAGVSGEALQSAAEALRLPQTPIVLIWGSRNIATDERFAALTALARVVVYNSSALGPDEGGLRELIDFVASHPDVAMCDLAYLRLAPWQDCVALFFDAKNVIRELFDLRRVEIAGGSAAEAYYLLGWLASRLEWSACSPRHFCNRFGTEITFDIALAGPPRRISRVLLSSSQTRFIAELQHDETEVIALHVEGAVHQPDRCRPITNSDTASLIERALLTTRPDRVFIDSLRAAGAVLASRTPAGR